MSEDDEINFYPPVAGGSVMKGLTSGMAHNFMKIKMKHGLKCIKSLQYIQGETICSKSNMTQM